MLDLKNKTPPGRHASHDDAESEVPMSDFEGHGLEYDYRQIVEHQFERWGIRLDCVHIEIRKLGHADDGLDVFVAMVRICAWDRPSVLRLLIGLPLLERRVRRAVRQSWLADLSHFTGLWVHASEHVAPAAERDELRALLAAVTLPVPDTAPG